MLILNMPDCSYKTFWDYVCADALAAGCSVDRSAPLMQRVWQTYTWARIRPYFACVLWLRINQLFTMRKWRGHFRIKIWRYYRFSNDISEYATIGPGLFLPHPIDITIGSAVKIGKNAILYNGSTLGGKRALGSTGMPTLGDGVIVYTGAKIVGPIQIGDNVEIGALTLCIRDVPSNNLMYGIPPNTTIRPKG